MHTTKITREQVYRAVILNARRMATPIGAPVELLERDPKAYHALNPHMEEVYHQAVLNAARAMAEILNTLAEEMDIDVAAIYSR